MEKAITLKKGDVKKEAYVGFSWTTFFFGFLVPLFRGDLRGAGYVFSIQFSTCFVTYLITSYIFVWRSFYGLTSVYDLRSLNDNFNHNYNLTLFIFWIVIILVNIVVAKSYNKYYIDRLLNNGYVPASENDKEILEMYI